MLLLVVTVIFGSCKKRASPAEPGPLAGDWSLYTADDTKIGILSFRISDSVYFDGCFAQSGVYTAAEPGVYRVTFAASAWACPAICFDWFPVNKGVTVKRRGDELLFYNEQETLLLKGRRPAPR